MCSTPHPLVNDKLHQKKDAKTLVRYIGTDGIERSTRECPYRKNKMRRQQQSGQVGTVFLVGSGRTLKLCSRINTVVAAWLRLLMCRTQASGATGTSRKSKAPGPAVGDSSEQNNVLLHKRKGAA